MSKTSNLQTNNRAETIGKSLTVIKILVCFLTLSVTGVFAQRTVVDAAKINEMRKNFVPITPNKATPVNVPDSIMLKGIQQGILSCDISSGSQENQTCVVRNMPLLQQTDARLENKASLGTIPNYGCYDTSILTIILTTLANRGGGLPALTGRVKELDDIQAANGIPKEVRQLSWYYRMVQKDQEANYTKPEFFPLYFPEVVAGFNKGKIIESAFGEKCDPYAEHYQGGDARCTEATNIYGSSFRYWEPQGTLKEFTNASIIQKMRDRYAMLISYKRYTPVIKVKNGKTYVAFEKPSNHKVVFSGFQSGEFPLLINDVGYGQRFKVRLGTDILKMLKLSGIKPENVEIFYPPNVQKTFIDYDGDQTNEIFFIEHIDGLRLPNK